MNKYFIITEEFAEANKECKIGNNCFGYGVTISGDYVCAIQSAIDFPEIFKDHEFKEVELGISDFPVVDIDLIIDEEIK